MADDSDSDCDVTQAEVEIISKGRKKPKFEEI